VLLLYILEVSLRNQKIYGCCYIKMAPLAFCRHQFYFTFKLLMEFKIKINVSVYFLVYSKA